VRTTATLLHAAAAAVLLLCAASAFASPEALRDAVRAVESGRYEEALVILRPLADAGDPEAQTILAGMYMNGWGVEKEFAQGLVLLEKSASKGNARAAFNLGRLYATGEGVPRDCERALTYFHAPAEAGNPLAEINLADLYATGGMCVTRDAARAAALYRSAAEKGNADAQHALASMYAVGEGVEKDMTEALIWYRRAAERGNAPSQGTLGYLYEIGEGVPRDPDEARAWYEKGAAGGDELSKGRLRLMDAGPVPAGVDPTAFEAGLTAPARLVAREVGRLESMGVMLALAERGMTIEIDGRAVTRDNVDGYRARVEAERKALDAALARRGAADVAGEYSVGASGACANVGSAWAAAVSQGAITRASLSRDGNDFTMSHTLGGDAEGPLEVPGVIVEDALVFADPGNGDYVLVGRVSDGRIVFSPDPDAVREAWPGAPSRAELESCRVTLVRQP
jgi:TPR repeat protein